MNFIFHLRLLLPLADGIFHANIQDQSIKKISNMISIKIIAAFALHLTVVREITGNSDAKRLYDDLLSNYNRLIRPVSNNTQTVLVKLGLRLSQLIDLVSVVGC